MKNKHLLFISYNIAKKQAKIGLLDGTILNRALGVAQRKEPRPYDTTLDGCSCPDHGYRHRPCKHMTALMLEHVMEVVSRTEKR